MDVLGLLLHCSASWHYELFNSLVLKAIAEDFFLLGLGLLQKLLSLLELPLLHGWNLLELAHASHLEVLGQLLRVFDLEVPILVGLAERSLVHTSL